jgi:hypothetical protein
MKYLNRTLIILTCLFFLSGCNTLGVGIQVPGSAPHKPKYHKHGPPPHAPAHGYRHKHYDGHELEYDSQTGAYIVLNIPGTYFGNNMYMRLSTYGEWMVSATLEGGWRVAVGNEVPDKLKTYKGKKQKKSKQGKAKKGKGHKKNKHGNDE